MSAHLVVVEHLGLVDGVDGVELVLPHGVLLLLPLETPLPPLVAPDAADRRHGQKDDQATYQATQQAAGIVS